MAEQNILPQGISFDTTGDESELMKRVKQNIRIIMVLKDEELMEKQKEFYEKVREVYPAKCDGNRYVNNFKLTFYSNKKLLFKNGECLRKKQINRNLESESSKMISDYFVFSASNKLISFLA